MLYSQFVKTTLFGVLPLKQKLCEANLIMTLEVLTPGGYRQGRNSPNQYGGRKGRFTEMGWCP